MAIAGETFVGTGYNIASPKIAYCPGWTRAWA